MKPLDFVSTILAGVFGALLLLGVFYIFARIFTNPEEPSADYAESKLLLLAAGFVVGAGVQTGVRLTGVS
jgi:hypothetical protein